MGFEVQFCSNKCRRSKIPRLCVAGGWREPREGSHRAAAGPSVLSPKQRAAAEAGSWVRACGTGLLAVVWGAPTRDFFLSRDEEELPLVSHILLGLSQQSPQKNCCFLMAQKPRVPWPHRPGLRLLQAVFPPPALGCGHQGKAQVKFSPAVRRSNGFYVSASAQPPCAAFPAPALCTLQLLGQRLALFALLPQGRACAMCPLLPPILFPTA